MSVATAAPFAADVDTYDDSMGEDALSRYLDEVGRHPLLSPSEELGLARRAKGGDAGPSAGWSSATCAWWSRWPAATAASA